VLLVEEVPVVEAIVDVDLLAGLDLPTRPQEGLLLAVDAYACVVLVPHMAGESVLASKESE
jgi:hypothetical protein